MKSDTNFQFYNQVTPRYLQPLFLQLDYGVWYNSLEMKELLRQNGLSVEGTEIVRANIDTWSLLQLGERKVVNIEGRKTYFRLNKLGKQLQETYSTNQELFFDLIHAFMYSAWYRSRNAKLGKFWLYASVCNVLWEHSPSPTDSFEMTGLLQLEAQRIFSEFEPKFPARSVTGVFPWLGALTPPFLIKETSRPQLFSRKREFCSPQLFHLALDLLYSQKNLNYGTSMAIGEEEIKNVCRACLLDEKRFWEMTDRTKLMIKGIEIRKGQFSTSLAMEQPPQWIDLPDYSNLPGDKSQDKEGDAE